jgi:hypothetical protein
MSAPILFLDIDGVLNASNRGPSGPNGMHPTLVARLERVIAATRCEIVVSSTWRLFEQRDDIEAWLRKDGAPSARVRDCTPRLMERQHPEGLCIVQPRGKEISAWLAEHRTEVYAIVDDDSDAGEGHEDRFVRTNSFRGLEDAHVERLIALLIEPAHPCRETEDELLTGSTTWCTSCGRPWSDGGGCSMCGADAEPGDALGEPLRRSEP